MTALWHIPSFGKIAYIGVAGAGGGQGAMGHVFLAVSDQPGQLLTATYYQYAIRLPQDFNFNWSDVISLGSFPFVIDSGKAWPFIKSYNGEDRVVILYELKLTDAQVEQIVERVEVDLKARAASTVFDYSVDTNNCATKIFDLVNSVVPHQAQLEYSPARQSLFKLDFFHASENSMTVPLGAAPQLERNALVATTIKFRQRSLADLQVTVTAFEQLNPLLTACEIRTGVRKVLSQMYGNATIRHSEKYLKVFSSFLATCAAKKKMTAIYNGHLDFLRFDTDERVFLDVSERYYLMPSSPL